MRKRFASPPAPLHSGGEGSQALSSSPSPNSERGSGGEVNSLAESDAIPRWLWRGAWVALGSVIVIGVVGVVLLSAGLADPPRAGPLVSSLESQESQTVLELLPDPADHYITSRPIALPHRPYTLEVTAQFSGDSDLAAVWEIVWDNPTAPFKITLNSQGYFSVVPPLPDSMPFFHIRPVGQPNRIALNVEPDGQGTLRINDEIAWRGAVPVADSAHIQAEGGQSNISHFVIQHIALYAPLSHS